MDKLFVIYVDALSIKSIKLNSSMTKLELQDLRFIKIKDCWCLESSISTIKVDSKKYRRVVLQPKCYSIENPDCFYQRQLFVYESSEGYETFTFQSNRPILIASHPKASIKLENPLMKTAFLYYHDAVVETNLQPLFVNGLPYHGEKLKCFSQIEWYGIVIHYHPEFLYLNHFYLRFKTSYYPKTTSYPLIDLTLKRPKFLKSVNKPNGIALKKPELAAYKPREFPSLIEQIGPGFTMSIAMCIISGINAYTNYQNGRSLIEILPFAILPFVMLLSTLIWPIIFRLIARRKDLKMIQKNAEAYQRDAFEYASRLYNDACLKKDELQREFFNYANFEMLITNNILFYKDKNSPLTISLGHYVKKLEYDISITELNSDFYRLAEYPLYIDLNINRCICVIENDQNDHYLIKKFILELSALYNSDDFLLAIYQKPDYLEGLEFIPLLFHCGKRYFIDSEEELETLDYIENKTIIIISFKQLRKPSNKSHIRYIYYGVEIDEGLKLVTSQGNGELTGNDVHLHFTYYLEDFDFYPAFMKIGRYLKNSKQYGDYYQLGDVFHCPLKAYDVFKNHLENQNGLFCDFAHFDQKICFDLHEKGHGPHGLIGGTTGSGKSELIIAMLLALCLKYSPTYLNIVIVDYKGGGIAQSLSYQNTMLPHIVAAISNLQGDSFTRLLIALKKISQERQKSFNELMDQKNIAIMNIDDYNYNSEQASKMARILIVVDEFAELKKQHPEQMKELVSLSRIGRSLGIHLILATQKPANCVDEEIWSNSRFKIALKVQDERDSRELIQDPKAAYLKRPGSFYLKVDQKMYSGLAAYTQKGISKLSNKTISILDNRCNTTKTLQIGLKNDVSELNYAVKKIVVLYQKQHFVVKPLFLMQPQAKKANELIKKYNLKRSIDLIVMGEIDDYQNMEQSILTYHLSEGHALMVSKRVNEVNCFLMSLLNSRRRIIYIGTSSISHPCVSDNLKYWDDDLRFLMTYTLKQTSKQDVVIIFEDLPTFLNYDDSYKEWFYHIIGIGHIINLTVIAFAKSASLLPYKAILTFNNLFAVGIKDKSDLSLLFNRSLDIKAAYCFKGRLLNYVPVELENNTYPKCQKLPYIKKIPDTIFAIQKGLESLIGYDLNLREPIYFPSQKSILIATFHQDDLSLYRRLYQKFAGEFVVYEHLSTMPKYDCLLWIGSGIFKQRLFHHYYKQDLKKDEGILLIEGQCHRIKVLNHE